MNDRKQFTVIIHKASLFIKLHPRIFFFFYIRCIERWIYLKALIVEAILVGSSLYEIRVNLICRIENIADVSLITLGGYLNDRDEAYLSGSGYGRKMISKNVGEIRAKNQKKIYR